MHPTFESYPMQTNNNIMGSNNSSENVSIIFDIGRSDDDIAQPHI